MKNKKSKNSTNKFINERIVEIIIIIAYLFILFLAWFDFYNLKPGNEIGFTLLYFYLLLPAITVIISIYIGKNKKLSNFKWFLVIIFGFLYMSPLFCLVIKDSFTIKEVFISYYDMIFNGVIVSLLGMVIGNMLSNETD